MPITVSCECGRSLKARDEYAGTRAECPTCGRTVQIPEAKTKAEPAPASVEEESTSTKPASSSEIPMEITDFFDPPAPSATPPQEPRPPVVLRMMEALLDPRSIHWMLMFGGGLAVLGLIIWLVSLGLFENTIVVAVGLGIGSLVLLAGGWWVTLKTKYRTAGQALTFLGCVVAPLNLWFYHAQDLVTLEGHLWIGGVVCCLLYAATVRVLRDPLFMYAVEGGITLTVLLLLADLGKVGEAPYMSLFFMAMGLISIHCERAFPPIEGPFTRQKFGLPLFWSGHVQIAVGLLILLGSQTFGWLAVDLLGSSWPGNLLTQSPLLAGAIWLAGTYAYLYSDIVVRRHGLYTCLAGFCLVLAEVTLLFGFDLEVEGLIAVLALTALGANLLQNFTMQGDERYQRAIPPLALILSALPVLLGLVVHMRATSRIAEALDISYNTTAWFVVAMIVVTASNRASAWLCRHRTPKVSAVYFFFSAAGGIVGAAGLLRVVGLTAWDQQAPILMLIPIAYLIGSRAWRGHSPERPLHWVAQTSTAVILVHVLLATLRDFTGLVPIEMDRTNLLLGLVFTEAAVFYSMAALFRKRSSNAFLAAAAACGAAWQFLGYWGVDSTYYTILYAVLGLVMLFVARSLGLEQVQVYDSDGEPGLATRGRGLSPYQSGNGILLVAFLAAFFRGLARLAESVSGELQWDQLTALVITTVASVIAIWTVLPGMWRRVYTTSSISLAALILLTLNVLIDLNGWQKLEIFCVIVGLGLLVATHIAHFREDESKSDEMVGFGLFLGSVMASAPLWIAVLYHRYVQGDSPTFDDFALLAITVLMVVTGVGWKVKATTLFGGGFLTTYLIMLIISIAYHPQVAVGVYLAVGGVLIFGSGIVLSIYREKLLELPERFANREGVFRVINWR
jgi:hypothetical protein